MCGETHWRSSPNGYEFLRDDSASISCSPDKPHSNSAAAIGSPGFPDVEVDSLKPGATARDLIPVERFPGAAPQRVLYSFHSDRLIRSAKGSGRPPAADASIHRILL